MKRKLFGIAMIIIAVSILAHNSLAHFTVSKVAHNVIIAGNVNIALLQWKDEARGSGDEFTDDEILVMPGVEVTKIVEIQNTGIGDAFVRVKLDKNILLDSGKKGDANLIDININE